MIIVCNWLNGLVGGVFANDPGDLGSIPGRVIAKTLKMVLETFLLNTQQYKVHIKGKVEQCWDKEYCPPLHLGVVAIEKGAFWSPSTNVLQGCVYAYIDIVLLSNNWSFIIKCNFKSRRRSYLNDKNRIVCFCFLCGLFNSFFMEEQQWYYLTHTWPGWGLRETWNLFIWITRGNTIIAFQTLKKAEESIGRNVW